ncbi:MAG: type VI secretion system tip protein VgrG [Chitinophagales bacterium]
MSVARTIPSTQTPDVVTYSILVDGEALPSTIPVRSMQINREINKIPFTRIRIADGDPSTESFPISDETYFIPGKEIEIQLGYRSDNTTVFKGIITGHSNKITSGNSEIIIECKDKAVKLTVGKKSKHFENITDSDIAEQIIDTYSLEKDIESTSTQHKEIIQFNTTDWDFMIGRMDVAGKICSVVDGKILIKQPELSASSVLDVLYGATILEYDAEIDSRIQFNEIKAVAWDYASQSLIEQTADEPSGFQDIGNLSNADLADVIGLESYTLIHSGKLIEEAAKAWADSKMMKVRLAKVRGHVKFQGFPNITPGNIISLNGVGDRFNGPVFVNAVKQDFTGGDWTTEIKFGLDQAWYTEQYNPHNLSAQSGLIPSVQGLQIGIVTDLEDPDGEHRVKVKLPVVNNDEEGIWMRIATLDAGNTRGTFFRPEIDDEVIVGFIFNDANHPVILGMLNSSALPPAITASNDNHEKGYISRDGIKMIFNDDEKSYKLETPGGKKITISDNDSKVQIEDENGNMIKFESSGVTVESATSLKIKAATDITIEAVNITLSPSSQFAVSAGGSEMKAGPGTAEIKSASVKIEGSGMTEVKGGIVKIN